MIAELCSYMIALDRRRSQPIATDRTNRTWLYSCNRLRSRSHSCSHIIGDDRTNRPWFFARDRTRSQSCSQIIGDDRWRSSLIICAPGFRLGVIVPTIIMTFHIRGSKDLWARIYRQNLAQVSLSPTTVANNVCLEVKK